MLGYRKPMSLITHFFVFFFFFFLSASGEHVLEHENHPEYVKLDLLHRHHPKVQKKLHGYARVLDRSERLKDIHEHDELRGRIITETLKQAKEKEPPVSNTYPKATAPPLGLKMMSAADYGSSQYFVQLRVGTPPQKFLLIADTGSDLTWINCRYRRCRGNCSSNPTRKNRSSKYKFKSKVFLANQSSSFKVYNCSHPKCKGEFIELFAMSYCPTPDSLCLYDYSYTGGSNARGFFSTETVTLSRTNGQETKLDATLLGCTESMNRVYVGADGVLGLGTNYFSLTSRATTASPGGLTYCLVDHLSDASAVSYLLLGPPGVASTSLTGDVHAGKMTYTKLILDAQHENLYGVELVGISVDGQMLNIPTRVFEGKDGGTVLDSGTSLTTLLGPAYEMVTGELLKSLGGPTYEFKPFEFCVDGLFDSDKKPKLRFHFQDGAVFSPPQKSYFVPALENTTCLGLVVTHPPSKNIIGNIMQQNHLWEYDFFKRTVGFAPSECQ